MKYILVYDVDGYPDEGGGTQCEEFDSGEALDKRVEEIYQEGHTLMLAGQLKEIKYKTIEKVTKVVVRDE